MNYLSQKELAEKLGVSKQRVYRCIKSNNIEPHHCEVLRGNSVMMYDEVAAERVKSLLFPNDSASQSTSNDAPNEAVNEALLKQLEVLQNQLQAKDKQIEMLHKALDQEQQLNAINVKKIELLESKDEEDPKEKKGFFARLLRR